MYKRYLKYNFFNSTSFLNVATSIIDKPEITQVGFNLEFLCIPREDKKDNLSTYVKQMNDFFANNLEINHLCLNIEYTNITPIEMKHVMSMLKPLKNLRSLQLKLYGLHLNSASLVIMTNALNNLKEISQIYLDLHDNNITASGLVYFLKKLIYSQPVKITLDLTYNPIELEAYNVLTHLINLHKRLPNIFIKYCLPMSEANLQIFLGLSQKSTYTDDFSFYFREKEPSSLTNLNLIAEMLSCPSSPQKVSFVLSPQNFNPEVASTFNRALKSNNKHLNTLKLDFASHDATLSSYSVMNLCQDLSEGMHLKKLELRFWGNPLPEKCVDELTKLLLSEFAPQEISFDLTSTKLNDSSMQKLMRVFNQSQTIKKLNLCFLGNKMNDKTSQFLCDQVVNFAHRFEELRLNIGSCFMPYPLVIKLVEYMKHCTNITSLDAQQYSLPEHTPYQFEVLDNHLKWLEFYCERNTLIKKYPQHIHFLRFFPYSQKYVPSRSVISLKNTVGLFFAAHPDSMPKKGSLPTELGEFLELGCALQKNVGEVEKSISLRGLKLI